VANQTIIQAGSMSSTSNDLPTDTAVTGSISLGAITYPFVAPFGSNSNPIAVYPNDTVQVNVYNAVKQYLESNYRVATFTKTNDTITLDLEKDVSGLGYISGKYRTEYKFYRNYLGSGDAHKMQIQEISADGLEIRVVPAISSEFPNTDFSNYFADGFFRVAKSQVLPNLFLHKDANTAMRVFDYVQDKFTFPTTPYSIIFKLNAPVPAGIVVGDFLWLSQQVSDTITDEVTIIPPKQKSRTVAIAGPNWDALAKENTSTATQYRDWDDLLSTNTLTSQQIVNKLLSGSLIEGIPLNIDYRSFQNFVTFGSATERLYNFRYKMQLLESYEARIQQLTTGLIGLPSSSVSSSQYFQSNVIDAETKKAALVGSFDGYEKYLYYNSSSYVTNSFGEFCSTTWPKSNTTLPYTNYSVTSSQADAWFEGIIESASLYDQNNDKALYKLIPAHVLQDDANEEYVLLTHMMGHYFDLIYAYVQQITAVHHRDESLLEGFSKELVYHVSKNLGVDFENGNTLEELWSYTLGTDSSGSLVSTQGHTTEDKTKEIWKRIVNNLPYLLKTKGTQRGVRALINCFGIPQTILRIREYGGAEPEFDSKTDLVYERFNYALQVGYSSNTPVMLQVPWGTLENGLIPMSTQIRAQMAYNRSENQILMEVPNQWYIAAYKNSGNSYIGFFLSGSSGWTSASVSSSIYDNTFHSITLLRELESDSLASQQTYKLIVKKTNYEKVVLTQTASLSINGAISSSYNSSFITSGTLWIPSSGSSSTGIAPFTGSIQEFRYWTKPLENSILDNHALAPTSFQGNTDGVYTGSTSSFADLSFRLCLGSDNKKINFGPTQSFNSQHPNQEANVFGNGALKQVLVNASLSPAIYSPVTEMHSLEWPDLGTNRSIGNKIRIENTFTAGTELYRNNSIQRSLSDNNPIDSPRLGIFLSPTNEVNQDIAEQFGGISIDDFIGDPSYMGLDNYPGLDTLKHEYSKKYNAQLKQQNYIRLLKYYDAALFKLIKKFVPYRANTQVGLVIEPDVLHRTKLPTKSPSLEDLQYSASLSIPEIYTVGGWFEDGDGEPFRNSSGYVLEATINENKVVDVIGESEPVQAGLAVVDGILLTPNFEEVPYDFVIDAGSQIVNPLAVRALCNEYNNESVEDNLTSANSLTSTTNIGESSYGRDTRLYGSQYTFFTYATSGSGPTRSEPYLITSSRFDYSEAYGPAILESRRSQIANTTNDVYDTDIFHNKAFSYVKAYASGAANNYGTVYTSSAAIYRNNWTSLYGLSIVSLYNDNIQQANPWTSTAYWSLSGSYGLQFQTPRGVSATYTASVKIPAFFYDEDLSTHNYIYRITLTAEVYNNNSDPNYLELHYGDLDCGTTGSISLAANTVTTTVIQTTAVGNYLGFRWYAANTGVDDMRLRILNLQVECLNYRAPVQDFHLQDSYGMKNARYDGCKMTSSDWNVNSPHTSDGGPVVVVTVGGGKQLAVKPSTRGNLRIQ
jgi:hypothetical protein